MAQQVRTVIVGAGAVGLALASCLHRAGQPLRFVVHDGETPHPLEQRGLARTGLFGDVRVPPEALRVHRSLAAAFADDPVDWLLVCTKTTAADEVAAALGRIWPRLSHAPRVLLCQNGWGNAERFARRLPADRIHCARIITGFRRTGPTEVDVTVHADRILVGGLDGQPSEPLRPLSEAIEAGGIPCATREDIGPDLWAKVLYNCVLNPLGALVGVPYGELGKRHETRAVMEAVAREIFGVLAASDHATHWSRAEDYMMTFYRDLLPPTAQHESSMLQDLRAGRATEIDALCGAVVELGRAVGVLAPVNQALTSLVHAAESRAADARSGHPEA